MRSFGFWLTGNTSNWRFTDYSTSISSLRTQACRKSPLPKFLMASSLSAANGANPPMASSGRLLTQRQKAKSRKLPARTESDVNDAVDAAYESFKSGAWRRMGPHERESVLHRIATLIDENADEPGSAGGNGCG